MLIFGAVFPWIVVALTLAAGAWVGFQLVQQNGRLLGRLESLEKGLVALSASRLSEAPPTPAPQAPAGLPLGFEAPAFELPDLDGKDRSLAEFRGRELLLLFFNP